MFPPSEPSDVKQDSKEQFKTKVTCFQPKLNSFPKFKWVENDLLKYIFKTLLVIWLTFYEKQNNGNLDVLKQDSYLDSLWLDYNICPPRVLETIFVFSDHLYMIFPTLLQVWTVVFKSGMIK